MWDLNVEESLKILDHQCEDIYCLKVLPNNQISDWIGNGHINMGY
jgi:hypothetical protein